MGYKIGSFNLCNFNYQSNKDIKKSFDSIANIIRSEGYDIVALQEVLSENTLKLLLKYLGFAWKYTFEIPITQMKDRRGEGYAYIWNSRRIDLVKKEDGNFTYPSIWKQYSKTYGELIRNPYYARFSPNGLPGGSFFEIRLINTHMLYGSVVNDRKKEFDILIKSIYNNISDRRYGNNMPAYTILLGDYNLNLNREYTTSPYLAETVYIDNGRITKTIITVQDELTTIKRPVSDENGNTVCDGYSNNFDHFSYDCAYENVITLKSSKVEAVEKYYKSDFVKYHREISDHVPISMELDLFV